MNNTEYTKVQITIPFTFNKPNANGIVFTEEAVERAVSALRQNIPIIFGDGMDTKAIGHTTGTSHIVTWDFENQICKVTVDGVLMNSGATIIINETEDNQVTDFRITSIGVSI